MIPPPFLLTNRFRRYRGIELIATDTRKSLPRTSNRAGVVHKGGCLGTIVTAPQYTIVREVLLLLDDDGSSSSFSPPMSTIPIYIRGRRVLVESIRPGSGRTGKGPLVVARSNEVAVTTTAINWTISELFVLLSRVEVRGEQVHVRHQSERTVRVDIPSVRRRSTVAGGPCRRFVVPGFPVGRTSTLSLSLSLSLSPTEARIFLDLSIQESRLHFWVLSRMSISRCEQK